MNTSSNVKLLSLLSDNTSALWSCVILWYCVEWDVKLYYTIPILWPWPMTTDCGDSLIISNTCSTHHQIIENHAIILSRVSMTSIWPPWSHMLSLVVRGLKQPHSESLTMICVFTIQLLWRSEDCWASYADIITITKKTLDFRPLKRNAYHICPSQSPACRCSIFYILFWMMQFISDNF